MKHWTSEFKILNVYVHNIKIRDSKFLKNYILFISNFFTKLPSTVFPFLSPPPPPNQNANPVMSSDGPWRHHWCVCVCMCVGPKGKQLGLYAAEPQIKRSPTSQRFRKVAWMCAPEIVRGCVIFQGFINCVGTRKAATLEECKYLLPEWLGWMGGGGGGGGRSTAKWTIIPNIIRGHQLTEPEIIPHNGGNDVLWQSARSRIYHLSAQGGGRKAQGKATLIEQPIKFGKKLRSKLEKSPSYKNMWLFWVTRWMGLLLPFMDISRPK